MASVRHAQHHLTALGRHHGSSGAARQLLTWQIGPELNHVAGLITCTSI